MKFLLLAYDSTHEAMAADAALAEAGFCDYAIIPRPSSISSRCGLALRIPWQHARRAIEILRAAECMGTPYASPDGQHWQPLRDLDLPA